MFNKFFTKKFLFILLFISIAVFCIFSNSSKAASSSALDTWVEEHKAELNNLFDGYDYLIVNNYWKNYVVVYYTNATNNKFYLNEEFPVNGDRRYIRSRSDLGNNYFSQFNLNPNNDNNFVIPTSLSTSFTPQSGDSCIVNNYSVGNILYASRDVYGNNCSSVIFEKKAFPPLPPQTIQEIVVEALNKILMTQVLGTQLTILVKVGLIIFGLLLAPFLLKYRN